MMNREERKNETFRQDLHQTWVKEAEQSPLDVPVDAERLWQRLDQSLTREKLSVVTPKTREPLLGPKHWALLGAAGLAFFLVMTRSLTETTVPSGTHLTITKEASVPPAFEDLVSHQREPLQTPSRVETPRCDQTRQSCLFVAFL